MVCVYLSALYFATLNNYDIQRRRGLSKLFVTKFEKLFGNLRENFFFQTKPNITGLFSLCRNVKYEHYSDRVGEGFIRLIKRFSQKAQKRYTNWAAHATKNFYVSQALRRFGSKTTNCSLKQAEWCYIDSSIINTEEVQSIVFVSSKFYLVGERIMYRLQIVPLAGKVSFFTVVFDQVMLEVDKHAVDELLLSAEFQSCLLVKNCADNGTSLVGYSIIAKYGDTYNANKKCFVPLMDAITDYDY